MPDQEKNIIEIVNEDPELLALRDEMVNRKLLIGNPSLHPLPYLINTEKIKRSWYRKKTKSTALAMGTLRYHRYYLEQARSILRHGDTLMTEENKKALEYLDNWRSKIKTLFPNDFKKLDKSCDRLGQYLEFITRESFS